MECCGILSSTLPPNLLTRYVFHDVGHKLVYKCKWDDGKIRAKCVGESATDALPSIHLLDELRKFRIKRKPAVEPENQHSSRYHSEEALHRKFNFRTKLQTRDTLKKDPLRRNYDSRKTPENENLKRETSKEVEKNYDLRINLDKSDSSKDLRRNEEPRYVSREEESFEGRKERRKTVVMKRQDTFFSIKQFTKIGASDEVIAALSSMGITKPSQIQAMAFKDVYRGTNCIIADQTGSGKTLAYLAPLIQRLRLDEEKGNFSTAKNPRAMIIVPTSELAVQVLSVCRAFSKTCPLKSMVATGGFKWKTQVDGLEAGPDILVTTPGRFLHHLKEETLELNKLSSIVLDEVDILLEEPEFFDAMNKIKRLVSAEAQYIHVTATLPTEVHDSLLQKFPDSVSILGPSLHLTVPGLKEILVDCSGDIDDERTPETAFNNKKAALIKLVDEQPVAKTIIFCNKIETCRKVENILNRKDRGGKDLCVLPYHAALSQEARLESMKKFQSSEGDKLTFLVCTDRASRGIDSIDVEHVILFDFPRDPSEYIRRVGRTARGVAGTGKVFVLVVGKHVGLARKIMERNENRQPVHTVPGF